MRKAGVIASVVVGVLTVAAQIYALPQQGGPQIKQKASKTATKAAAHAKVLYNGPPQFAGIKGTSITYATNAAQPVLKIGETFYFRLTYFNASALTERNVWLVSASAQGPWTPARFMPQTVAAIVCAQLNADPFEPYQLCTLPWPT